MSYENTSWKGDYLFLQRFLDATKANLFFARGILMVEGDAGESLATSFGRCDRIIHS